MIPNFQGVHLFDRLCWAKQHLQPIQTDYCVVWQDPEILDSPCKVTTPDPNWLACAVAGGILPDIRVYFALHEDEAKPDFRQHTRGYLLHNTKPIDAMSIEQSIEYLIMKDIPQRVWRDYQKANQPRLVICKKSQLPKTRMWRNAWKIDENIFLKQDVA